LLVDVDRVWTGVLGQHPSDKFLGVASQEVAKAGEVKKVRQLLPKGFRENRIYALSGDRQNHKPH
jgi:hypothetical protein